MISLLATSRRKGKQKKKQKTKCCQFSVLFFWDKSFAALSLLRCLSSLFSCLFGCRCCCFSYCCIPWGAVVLLSAALRCAGFCGIAFKLIVLHISVATTPAGISHAFKATPFFCTLFVVRFSGLLFYVETPRSAAALDPYRIAKTLQL